MITHANVVHLNQTFHPLTVKRPVYHRFYISEHLNIAFLSELDFDDHSYSRLEEEDFCLFFQRIQSSSECNLRSWYYFWVGRQSYFEMKTSVNIWPQAKKGLKSFDICFHDKYCFLQANVS